MTRAQFAMHQSKPSSARTLSTDGSSDDGEHDQGEEAPEAPYEGRKDFRRVLLAERTCIDKLRKKRCADGDGGVPFSLAFSGGGIRAAAFQAGVLWRLAQMNRLKDVEYFAAVSGGGYITSAFATHCLAEPLPAQGEVRDWYLRVVAKTLTRMQENSGDFVRDCVKEPCGSSEGSGCLPRVFDLPILIATVIITLSVQPIFLVVAVLVPIAAGIEIFYGSAMRAAFCAPPDMKHTWYTSTNYFWEWSGMKYRLVQIGLLLALSVLVMFVRELPCCKLGSQTGRARPQASMGYLLGFGLNAFLTRCVVTMSVFYVGLYGVLLAQEAAFTRHQEKKYDLCSSFIAKEMECPHCGNFYPSMQSSLTTNYYSSTPWYEDAAFQNYTATLQDLGLINDTVLGADDTFDFILHDHAYVHRFLIGAAFVSVCVMPLIGGVLLKSLLHVAGPIYLMMCAVGFVQAIVFGHINRINEIPSDRMYDETLGARFITCCLVLNLFVTPFYEELRSVFHRYYWASLTRSFFEGGRDPYFTDLVKCAYCPFIILTGTCNDYQPPGETDTIAEVSFSALHTGGDETGYFEMPPWRSIGKCTAITGAGCLDAISLSMSDMLSLRFWLEMLNLSWGDFVIFEDLSSRFFKLLMPHTGRLTEAAVRSFHRLIGGFPVFLFFSCVLLGWTEYLEGRSVGACQDSAEWIHHGLKILVAVVALSFFPFIRWVSAFSFSPFIRQFHQATKYFYVGNRPPMMLYMTDGGVKDCTAVSQLLWRRCERILLVLAAADPRDELGVLKAAMKNATELKLATFYDPRDPRNDIQIMFDQFRLDKSASTLQVGIGYCFGDDSMAEPGKLSGQLIIVKNRLPAHMEGQPIQPLLTSDEIRASGDWSWPPPATGDDSDFSDAEAWADLTTDQLGPFGCCDCCHTQGLNCGPKFPHGTFTGYLYLSPQWCNSLMRLGHAVSGGAIEAITHPGPLAEQWEAMIRT